MSVGVDELPVGSEWEPVEFEPLDDEWVPSEWDALICPDETAARLRELSVSSRSASVVAVLDPQRMSAAGRIDLLYLLRRQAAVLEAAQLEVLAAVRDDEHADPWTAQFKHVEAEVAPVLQVSDASARDRLRRAAEMTRLLPATVAALRAGEPPIRPAECLHERVADRTPAVSAAIEADMLPRAGISLVAWRRRINLLLVRLDPRTEDERRERAVEDRAIRIWHDGPGMDRVMIDMPCGSAASMTAFTDAAVSRARRDPADARTVDQVRVDAIGDLFAAAVHADQHPTAQGTLIRPAVVVGLETLLGLDDLPARIDGHDDITAVHARALVAETIAHWSLHVVDRRGRLIDRIEHAHEPSPRLKAFIASRDVFCQFPGCSRRAVFCDQDHIVDWPIGQTCAAGLHSLCRAHHNAKTSGAWTVTQLADIGAIERERVWTSPTGHTFSTAPDQRARHDDPLVLPSGTADGAGVGSDGSRGSGSG